MATLLQMKLALKQKLSQIPSLPNFRKNEDEEITVALVAQDEQKTIMYPGIYIIFREASLDRETLESEQFEEEYDEEDSTVAVTSAGTPMIFKFHVKTFVTSQEQDDIMYFHIVRYMGKDMNGYLDIDDEILPYNYATVHNYKYDDLTKDLPKYHRQWEFQVYARITEESVTEPAIEEISSGLYQEEILVDTLQVDTTE